MRISEQEYDHAFAEAFEVSEDFRQFVLSGGRFARFADTARLLRTEQEEARQAKHWWKHWWCNLPNSNSKKCETDIFLVFECEEGRFALHIENKPPDGKLSLEQASAYRKRAAFKSNDEKWLNYQDFETIILAPTNFIVTNATTVSQFDRALTYEDVANHVSKFAD